MQITSNKRRQAMLAAIGLLGTSASLVTTASADAQTAEGFDLTKQATTAPFPVVFDRPSGVNASALAGAIRTLGTNSELYKQAVAAVPELADSNKMNSLLNDALSGDAGKASTARATILKLINWYNSLGGFQIKTQSGEAYTVDNLDAPINTIAVGFANKSANPQVSNEIQKNFGSVSTVGDVMKALDAYKAGTSKGYKSAFDAYAAKVTAPGADIKALSQIDAVAPLLNAYENMYANGAASIRDQFLKKDTVTEASVAFFESAVITGQIEDSSNGTTDQNNVPQKKLTTRWVTSNGKELSPNETGDSYKSEKTFEGYTLTNSKTENGTRTYVYEQVTEKTRWVDTDGKSLKAETKGTYPDREGDDIPGYKLVEFKTEKNGPNTVTTNVYKKVETPAPTPEAKKPDTYWFDDQGKELKPVAKEQTLPDNDGVSDIPGYTLLRAYTVTQASLNGDLKGTKFQVGDVINIYQKDKEPEKPAQPTPQVKVTTKWVDKDGKTLKDTVEGSHPDKEGDDVPGYRLIHTIVDKDGNVTNVYEKVEQKPARTNWVDKNGKTLKDSVEGSHPDKEGDDIPGYKFIRTDINKETGDVTNVYEKNPTTKWVDTNGKTLKDSVEGSHPDKEGDDIPGYKFVRTDVDKETGDVTNVYEKVTKKVITHWTDTEGKRLSDDETGEDFKAQKSFDGYHLKEVRMSKDGTEKFYIYEKDAAPKQKELPNTGEASSVATMIGGVLTGIGGLGLFKGRKKDEDA